MKNLQKIVLLLALAFFAMAGDSQTSKARKTAVKEIITWFQPFNSHPIWWRRCNGKLRVFTG